MVLRLFSVGQIGLKTIDLKWDDLRSPRVNQARNIVDLDGDGLLNYQEFKNICLGFAAVHTQRILNLYDSYCDSQLDLSELAAWQAERTPLSTSKSYLCTVRSKTWKKGLK